jgi:hypothetical protein
MSKNTSARQYNRFLKLVQEVLPSVKEISVDTFAKSTVTDADALVVDIREPVEWKQGIIPQSYTIPRGVLEKEIERLAKSDDQEVGVGYDLLSNV